MSSAKYHKTATRDIRPFFSVASLEEAINGAQIRLYDDQPFTNATSFTVEEQDVPRLAPTVRPNLDGAALDGGSIGRSKLAMAVTAVNPFLKKTVLVHKEILVSQPPKEIAIGSEVLECLGGGSNITIEVALCLATALKKEAGKPFLKGHWLSKKTFELRPSKMSEDFDVEATDDDGWKAMGYPAKTLYHVDYYSGFNEPASKDRPVAKVRIHADVFKRLAADNQPKMSRPICAFLAAEIACQLLAASLSEWKDVEHVEPRSPLSAFLKRINRIRPCTLHDLRKLLEQPGLPILRAILHADQDSVRRVAEA